MISVEKYLMIFHPMWLKVWAKVLVHFIEDKWTIECEVYIDDAPYQLENFKEKVPDKKIIRYVRTYNKPIDGVLDIHSWNELIPLLNSF